MRYQVTRCRRAVLLAALVLGAVVMTVSCAVSSPVAAPGPVPRPSPTLKQPPAPPATDAFTYVPLLKNMPIVPTTGAQNHTVLATGDFMMEKGDMRRVTDQLDIRIASGHGSQDNNLLICFGQQGNVIDQVSTGTNTNDSDPYQWNVSLLLVAPATENYYCQIQTYASDKDPSYVMTVLAPAPGQTTYGTWLKFSSGNEANAQGWLYFTCTQATATTCCTPKDANHTCQYIGGSGRPSSANLGADYWLADPDATTFDAVATFMITDCWASIFAGSDSCLASDRGDGIFGQSSAEGETWLEVDQLYPDGSVCQANRGYSEESTGGQVQLSESYDDSDAQHHLPLYYDLSAPVSQLCRGSLRFAVDLYIGWTSGNPVKLDGGNINLIDSVRATTTVVPDVTGRTQAQADEAIEANGLTTWPAPDYVTSTAPIGTVLGQNSPAGTIEPVGSPVQLTLSLGYATVPNVVGDSVVKAEAAIRSAGLRPTVNSSVSNCVQPSIVLSQNPGRGTQVAPGSQVGIGITACTR
jgi:hypothetical protein